MNMVRTENGYCSKMNKLKLKLHVRTNVKYTCTFCRTRATGTDAFINSINEPEKDQDAPESDVIAACSDDEENDADEVDTVRDNEADIINGENSDEDDSDEECKELMKRKKNLESTKLKLKDEKEKKKYERERRKQLLKAEVETLENEVKELTTQVTGPDYKQVRFK